MDVAGFVRCVAGKGCPGSGGVDKVNGAMHSSGTLGLRAICTADGSGAAGLMLPSGTPEERAEVDSWIDFAATTFSAEHVPSIDQHLSRRSFLAGGSFSLADIVVYFACAPVVARMDSSSARKALNFSRWFNNVQHRVKTMAPSYTALPAHVTFNLFTPVPVPLPSKASDVPKPKEKSPGSDQPKETLNDGGSKKNRPKADNSANGIVPSVVPGKGGSTVEAVPSEAGGDPSRLDVRVGVIVKAWEHPDSEKLFCEEIDLGEGKTRNIASGLRAFYTLEEMQGRRVIVLGNLKARNIGGFKSEGMVLCASSDYHSVVKIIEPPPGAAVGARVTISGTEGEPATPAQMAKKKILEKCSPKLRTNSEGIAGYDGVGVFNVEGEACVTTIPNAFVS